MWWGQTYSLYHQIQQTARCSAVRSTHSANRSITQPNMVGSGLLTLPMDPSPSQMWWEQAYSLCQQIHQTARCGRVRPTHFANRSIRHPDVVGVRPTHFANRSIGQSDVVGSDLLTLPRDPSDSQMWWGQTYSLCQQIHQTARCGGVRPTHFANRSIRQPDVVGPDLVTYSLCQQIHQTARSGRVRSTHFANRSIRQPGVVGSDLLTLPTDPSASAVVRPTHQTAR